MTIAPVNLRLERSVFAILSDVALAAVCALTARAHAERVLEGHLTSMGFTVEQALLFGMVILRRRTSTTSPRLSDWTVATLGGWLPLAMRPGEPAAAAFEIAGAVVQLIGLALTCGGFLALGRSFGVVAANRGLKVSGMYRIVRHPVYFSHTITLSGFLLANMSLLNVALLLIITVFQVLRIGAEERVLRETSDYESYAARVRWRLLPGVY